jgi:hypothetical protein
MIPAMVGSRQPPAVPLRLREQVVGKRTQSWTCKDAGPEDVDWWRQGRRLACITRSDGPGFLVVSCAFLEGREKANEIL